MKLTFSALVAALLVAVTSQSYAADGVPADYPLKKCPVSGESLGEHGKPVKVSHDGTDVYLCCKNCTDDFKKDAAKYVEEVKTAKK